MSQTEKSSERPESSQVPTALKQAVDRHSRTVLDVSFDDRDLLRALQEARTIVLDIVARNPVLTESWFDHTTQTREHGQVTTQCPAVSVCVLSEAVRILVGNLFPFLSREEIKEVILARSGLSIVDEDAITFELQAGQLARDAFLEPGEVEVSLRSALAVHMASERSADPVAISATPAIEPYVSAIAEPDIEPMAKEIAEAPIPEHGNGQQTTVRQRLLDPALPRDVALAVARRILKLLEKKMVSQQMTGWEQWNSLLTQATADDANAIRSLYESVVIPREILQGLVSDDPKEEAAARKHVRSQGGFLNHCDAELVDAALREQGTVIIRDDEQNLVAFYSVITNQELVFESLKEEIGFDRDIAYSDSSQLPLQSVAQGPEGGKRVRTVTWQDPNHGMQFMQDLQAGRVAYSVDMAVTPDSVRSGAKRNLQVATACKRHRYRQVQEALGEDAVVIMKVFKILAVGEAPGQLIDVTPHAKNSTSAAMNERLGASELCTMDEIIERDGLFLKVRWIFYVQKASDGSNFGLPPSRDPSQEAA